MIAMRDAAAVVGVGETAYARRSPRSGSELVLEAVGAAIADAGLRPADIDGVVTERVVVPQLMPQDVLAATVGIGPYYSATATAFGAGIGGAVLLAAQAIATGQATAVLCYFGVDWGSNTAGAYGASDRGGSPKANVELPYGFYGQPMYFAQIATRYAHLYGVDLEPALSAIAIQQRRHAVLSGDAQQSRPLDLDAYRASPLVAEPLRVVDCCLLTDGAAAVVLTSAERAADRPHRPVYLKGASFQAAPVPVDWFFAQNPDFGHFPAARTTLDRALAIAGVRREELDFLELYDCFTISLLAQLEDLGFCARGEGVAFVGDGRRLAFDGSLAVNTHGGLLSHDYLLGMSHIVEAVRQLRGHGGARQVPDAAIGLVGLLATAEYCSLVFGRTAG